MVILCYYSRNEQKPEGNIWASPAMPRYENRDFIWGWDFRSLRMQVAFVVFFVFSLKAILAQGKHKNLLFRWHPNPIPVSMQKTKKQPNKNTNKQL